MTVFWGEDELHDLDARVADVEDELDELEHRHRWLSWWTLSLNVLVMATIGYLVATALVKWALR